MGTQGLTCDNLVRADVATADGRLAVAGVDGDPELLWALRGGGGNFGVVTSFEFRLRDPGQILGGYLKYPLNATEAVLRHVSELSATAPDELEVFVLVRAHDPTVAPTPAEVSVGICWTGDASVLERILLPLRRDPALTSDNVGPISYPDIQAMSGRLPFGLRHYWKGHFLGQLGDSSIAGIVDALAYPPGSLGGVLLEAVRGAARHEPEGGSAFGHRTAAWNVTALGIWADPGLDDTMIAWARRLADRLEPDSLGAGYANYAPVDETPERVLMTFGHQRYRRLAEVKRRYDPDNRFRFNLNIPPAPTSPA
jgi:FAD/FMN-containing dehydrogenase